MSRRDQTGHQVAPSAVDRKKIHLSGIVLGKITDVSDFGPFGFNYYRPQTKFAKVMFSQLFVCWGGGAFCPGDLCQRDPPYGKERAVCILLECILVYFLVTEPRWTTRSRRGFIRF